MTPKAHGAGEDNGAPGAGEGGERMDNGGAKQYGISTFDSESFELELNGTELGVRGTPLA